ncbi:hypothetical protein MTR_2g089315 [Medicago truncatula]|uniref:Uncharacterized protein n=1 Tax=Medicago truncatula TaxID=3880 RepID=A0A072VLJ4_MEDTR|nr:hypothetical protein MTR_2g089315 [Medicago truncatula]
MARQWSCDIDIVRLYLVVTAYIMHTKKFGSEAHDLVSRKESLFIEAISSYL